MRRFSSLIVRSLALISLGLFGFGCATQTSSHPRMLGPLRRVTNPAGVHIYSHAPRKHYEEIAIIEGRTQEEMRIKAAEVGGNGVILGPVVSHPGPVIGFGFGTSRTEFNRHGVTDYGGGASFAIPTGKSAVEGMAIFIP